MPDLTPAQQKAEFLRALADHLDAHPDLTDADAYGPAHYRQLRIFPSGDRNGSAPAALAAWARTLGAGDRVLRVTQIPDNAWSSVKFAAVLAGHHQVEVWAPVDDLPGDVTSLTVAELEHFATHGTLPVAPEWDSQSYPPGDGGWSL